MKKSNSKLIYILIIVFVSCFVGMMAGAGVLYTIEYHKIKNEKVSSVDEINEVYNKIVEEYYDTVDKDRLIQGAVSGMLSVLDTHTSYMNKSDTQSFTNKMNGEYYGIGIEALTITGEGILVVNVLNNSPSERSGLLSGDIITSLNGESLKDKTASYFTSVIADSDDELKLVVDRNGRDLDFSVKPEKVTINSVTSDIIQIDNKKIGYINISVFALNTASQFSTELSKLEANGIESLIIDVRNNSGGYLSSVTTMLELFMPKGYVLYKTESKEETLVRKDDTDDSRNYKVNILVNGSSASASEILASCFKDNMNSNIIGTRTYGKGTVQETVNLSNGSMAKITTKKWLTPNGDWINEIGVKPTIEVDLDDEYTANPIRDNDNQLQAAINDLLK